MWSRIHLIPLLQAEEDRDQVRRYWADQAREKELMGSSVKVYHTDRCVSGFWDVTCVCALLTSGQICETDLCNYALEIGEMISSRRD